MIRSRDELLDTLHRLEKNPATAHLMVRRQKGKRVKKLEEIAKSHASLDEVVSATVAAQPGLDDASAPLHENAIFLGESGDAAPAGPRNSRWMRADDVLDYLGVCRATLYRAINNQGFPRPRKLGNVSLWLRDEIDDFMIALPVMEIPRIDWPDGKKPRAKKSPGRG